MALDREKCIACGLCATTCPNRVITVETVKDKDARRRLQAYWVERGRCIHCGLCVEVCPKQALYWVPDFEKACYRRTETAVNLGASSEVKADG
ncbi:4Fe-4S dicluster domain-containing protein [Desulfothermobacter acidiphilus]|uniref:4Fe-4S dicluster domain-containing protein n=1 Tax=Desulfothermobacter acidiphilus TaxID=1938353 RepID=UPI003F89A976